MFFCCVDYSCTKHLNSIEVTVTELLEFKKIPLHFAIDMILLSGCFVWMCDVESGVMQFDITLIILSLRKM